MIPASDHPRGVRWERLRGVVDVDDLRTCHVLVIGLGSGGSTLALELAKAGVGRFTLVDPDVVEEVNLIRHECDDRYVGWNKTVAVADLIHHRNPEAAIEALPVDVFDLRARMPALVESATLVAVCTDTESSKHLVNRVCLATETPSVYAGVYERGVGGEVIRCDGGPADPCYACVASALKEAVDVTGDEEVDYGLVDADGVLHGARGLGIDVRLIALIQAKVCLLVLLEGAAAEPGIPGTVVLFATASIDGLFARPFAGALIEIAPQDGCLVCGGTARSGVGTAHAF